MKSQIGITALAVSVALCGSYGTFRKRLRKVMVLIPLKARTGIAALTFVAATPW